MKIAVTDAEAEAQNNAAMSDSEELEKLKSELPKPETFGKLRITPHEFEKDDDSNGHIDFIVGKSLVIIILFIALQDLDGESSH